jgi:hypothetical protein
VIPLLEIAPDASWKDCDSLEEARSYIERTSGPSGPTIRFREGQQVIGYDPDQPSEEEQGQESKAEQQGGVQDLPEGVQTLPEEIVISLESPFVSLCPKFCSWWAATSAVQAAQEVEHIVDPVWEQALSIE